MSSNCIIKIKQQDFTSKASCAKVHWKSEMEKTIYPSSWKLPKDQAIIIIWHILPQNILYFTPENVPDMYYMHDTDIIYVILFKYIADNIRIPVIHVLHV